MKTSVYLKCFVQMFCSPVEIQLAPVSSIFFIFPISYIFYILYLNLVLIPSTKFNGHRGTLTGRSHGLTVHNVTGYVVEYVKNVL